MILIAVAVGLALLFFGRQLFWLFVGGAGFAVGTLFAAELLKNQSDWAIVIAVLAGVLGALLAIFLQRIAVAVAGFLTGAYIVFSVAEQFNESFAWAGFLIGGILGALLVMVLFEWALVVLSSLTGAVLLTESLALEPPVSIIVFGVCFLAGLAAQAGQLHRHRKRTTKAKATS